jgi:hypothetical protein
MKQKKRGGVPPVLLFLAASLPFLSCGNLFLSRNHSTVICPETIALEAADRARQYSEVETRYLWGGQDELDAGKPVRIDCSGMVVNSYRHAVRESGYDLPFADARVEDFFDRYTVRIMSPRAGDVIFIGSRYRKPGHIAIFVRREEDRVWFIDSTYNEAEGIDGVTLRSWPADDRRFVSFGRLLLRRGY